MKLVSRSCVSALVCVGLSAALASPAVAQKDSQAGPAQLIGTWRGTSTCTDRVAAPACNDETVVYEFSAGPKPGLVHWKADKIVNGQREPMGEFDLAYDKTDACWKAEDPRTACHERMAPHREGRAPHGDGAAAAGQSDDTEDRPRADGALVLSEELRPSDSPQRPADPSVRL